MIRTLHFALKSGRATNRTLERGSAPIFVLNSHVMPYIIAPATINRVVVRRDGAANGRGEGGGGGVGNG